jgi:multisubunit Na+/H+ antiporter MnhE subunit
MAAGLRHEKGMLRRTVWWITAFAGTFGLWMLFVDKAALHEVIAGLGGAVLAATASEVVRGNHHPRFWPHIRWFLELWRVLKDILDGCILLTRCLITGCPGILRQTHFEFGGQDRYSAARRALAIAFGSIAPNSIIIGIDQRTGLLLVHLADHAPLPKIARLLGAMR